MDERTRDAFMRLNNRIKALEESIANNKPRTVTEYSQECDKIVAALINASKSFKPLTKESKGNHHKYSSLEEMYEATVPSLLDNDIQMSQDLVTQDNGQTYIETQFRHISGQYKRSMYLALDAEPSKGLDKDQQRGKSNTYSKRYAYSSALGLRCVEPDSDEEAFAKDAKPNPSTHVENLGNCSDGQHILVKKEKFNGCKRWRPDGNGCNYKEWF